MAGGDADSEARAPSAARKWLRAGIISAVIATAGAVGMAILNPFGERVANNAYDALFSDGPQLIKARETWPIDSCNTYVVVGTDSLTKPQVTWHDIRLQYFDYEGRVAARKDWIAAGGGPIGQGILTLYLTADTQETLFVTDIKVNVFSRTDVKARWGIPVDQQCGGDVYERTFFANLNRSQPVLQDLGVTKEGSNIRKQRVPTEPLGPSFTISQKIPSRIQIVATSCQQTVTWGLSIEYSAGGESKVMHVGTPEDPFVILAGDSPAAVLRTGGEARRLDGPMCLTNKLKWNRDYYPFDGW